VKSKNQRLHLNGESVTVLGVMPAGFDHPLLWGRVSAWRPIAFKDDQRQERKINWVGALAHLKPGISRAQAQAEMSAIAARLAREHSDPNSGLRVAPLKGSTTSDVGRNISQFALGLSGFVLLIACVNLANLALSASREAFHQCTV